MALGEKYDRIYKDAFGFPPALKSGWPRDRFHAVCFPPGEGETILDIGCGTGWVLYYFRKRYRVLCGAELSKIRLEHTRELLSGHNFQGYLIKNDTLEGVPADSMDRVVSSDVIEHVLDIYTHAAEMYRVLKPGGDLVINTPNVLRLKLRARAILGDFPGTGGGFSDKHELYDGGHLHYFTFDTLQQLLTRSGFEIIGRLGFGRFGRIHNLMPGLLSSGVQIHARKGN